jgi:hypothetical protein
MRRMTRNIEGAPWETTPLIQMFGASKNTADTFADVFWSLLLSDSSVFEAAKLVPSTLRATQYFIVGYTSQSGYRRDLLIFGPEELSEYVVEAKLRSNWQRVMALVREMFETVSLDTRRSEIRLREMIRIIMGLARNEGERLFRDFINQTTPAIVVIPTPSVIPQASLPCAAISVSLDSLPPIFSTAGVVARNQAGQNGVTMAYHALKIHGVRGCVGQPVKMDGQAGRVLTIDEISDSAFVALDKGIAGIPSRPFKNVRRRPVPGLGENANFVGLASGTKSTVITSAPPTLLISHPGLQRQILTNPDTLPSDSGCALIDDTDQLVGFCFGGSGTDSPMVFSIWIWADSVFEAHRLT